MIAQTLYVQRFLHLPPKLLEYTLTSLEYNLHIRQGFFFPSQTSVSNSCHKHGGLLKTHTPPQKTTSYPF